MKCQKTIKIAFEISLPPCRHIAEHDVIWAKSTTLDSVRYLRLDHETGSTAINAAGMKKPREPLNIDRHYF
jgi:hypothetical protein